MKNLSVKSIKKEQTKEWFLYKHYAKRLPSVSFAFGLFHNEELIGVCTFGKPASYTLCEGVCGKKNTSFVYELNRLCINENTLKNSLSFFVGQCLKKLPSLIIVSYADTAHNHNGYIYQATNWIYTGKTKERTDIATPEGRHQRHYNKNLNYSNNRKFRSAKHRYIYFTGSKTQRKNWERCLNYKKRPYPKGKNKRYNASYIPNVQINLF